MAEGVKVVYVLKLKHAVLRLHRIDDMRGPNSTGLHLVNPESRSQATPSSTAAATATSDKSEGSTGNAACTSSIRKREAEKSSISIRSDSSTSNANINRSRTQDIEGHPFRCNVCDKSFKTAFGLLLHGSKINPKSTLQKAKSKSATHDANHYSSTADADPKTKTVPQSQRSNSVPNAKKSPFKQRSPGSSTGQPNLGDRMKTPESSPTKRTPSASIAGLQLIDHTKSHSPRKNSFQCKVCSQTFSLQHQLMRHSRDHKARRRIKVHKCHFCEMEFPYKSRLQIHMVRHTREKAFQCSICKLKFGHSSALRAHSRKGQCYAVISSPNATFKCSSCSQNFGTKISLALHALEHTDEDLQPCQICRKLFIYKSALQKHIRNHARPRKSAATSAEVEPAFIHECNICKRSFKKKIGLDRHQKYVHKYKAESQHPCQVCGKTFTYAHALRWHSRKHVQREPKTHQHACETCGKLFASKSTLLVHTRSHHSQKPPKAPAITVMAFSCETCNRSFGSKQGLARHILVHKDGSEIENLYFCDCGKLFANQTSLLIHKESHNQVPKIKSAFNTPPKHPMPDKNVPASIPLEENNAKRPMNVQNLKLPRKKMHTCVICKKEFLSKSSLDFHKIVHTGIKPLVCNFCKISFIRSEDLRGHQCRSPGMKLQSTVHGFRPTHLQLGAHNSSGVNSKSVKMSDNRAGQLQCNICKKQLGTKAALIRHFKSHLGVKDYACEICEKCFTTKQGLDYHILARH